MLDLLSGEAPWREALAPGAVILRRQAIECAPDLLVDIERLAREAPFRQMVTPGGHTMSVAMTNCGLQGWVTDRTGYRYSPRDPLSERPWPAMPASFQALCAQASWLAEYPTFTPDSCLVNRYVPGAKMSLHQDKDERDLQAPIVSVSLGLPALFLFGGARRDDPVQRVMLEHGDVVVWGGRSRLFYHGIGPLKVANHPLTGAVRYNLTFRASGKNE